MLEFELDLGRGPGRLTLRCGKRTEVRGNNFLMPAAAGGEREIVRITAIQARTTSRASINPPIAPWLPPHTSGRPSAP